MEQAKKAFKTIVMMSSKIIERGDNDSFRKYESQRLTNYCLRRKNILICAKKFPANSRLPFSLLHCGMTCVH